MTKVFNGEMLTLARQFRRMSQEELADTVGSKQGVLSKIERGQVQPEEKLIEKFASALILSPSFFFDQSYRRMPPVSFHRKRRKLASRELEAIHAKAEIYRLNLKRLIASIELDADLPAPPAIDPDQFNNEIEKIAHVVRQRWAVPRGPVRDLTSLVEKSGIIIVSFEFGTPLIDGFAQHEGDGLPPVIFLNSRQPKDRWRFSLAHELGHLVMHHAPNPEQEVQANLFASAFLMPRRDIESEFDHPSVQKFMELKMYWGTSMQALVYKAWELGRISDRSYKYFAVEISKRGWKAKEPVEIYGFNEQPELLREIVNAHVSDLGYSLSQLSDVCGLINGEFEQMYPFTEYSKKPKLRIVN